MRVGLAKRNGGSGKEVELGDSKAVSLTAEWRISCFKLAIITYKASHTGFPPNLTDLFERHKLQPGPYSLIPTSSASLDTTYLLEFLRFAHLQCTSGKFFIASYLSSVVVPTFENI